MRLDLLQEKAEAKRKEVGPAGDSQAVSRRLAAQLDWLLLELFYDVSDFIINTSNYYQIITSMIIFRLIQPYL